MSHQLFLPFVSATTEHMPLPILHLSTLILFAVKELPKSAKLGFPPNINLNLSTHQLGFTKLGTQKGKIHFFTCQSSCGFINFCAFLAWVLWTFYRDLFEESIQYVIKKIGERWNTPALLFVKWTIKLQALGLEKVPFNRRMWIIKTPKYRH